MVPIRYGRQAKKVVDPTATDGGSAETVWNKFLRCIEALNQLDRVSIKFYLDNIYSSLNINTALALYGQAARAISIG